MECFALLPGPVPCYLPSTTSSGWIPPPAACCPSHLDAWITSLCGLSPLAARAPLVISHRIWDCPVSGSWWAR